LFRVRSPLLQGTRGRAKDRSGKANFFKICLK
jgi:hypothetical protein